MKLKNGVTLKGCFIAFLFIFLMGCQGANSSDLGNQGNDTSVEPIGENSAPKGGSEEEAGDPIGDPVPSTYTESFAGPDSASWPDPWQVAENSPVTTAQIQGGKAQLQGPTGMVARMVQTNLDFLNCDATFTVEFENFSTQGCGFYCRQNGGYLTLSNPNGQGYALFLEGNSNSLTLWYERDGDEIQHQAAPVGNILTDPIQNSTPYHLRLQVIQISPNETQQRAKLWLAGDSEPAQWHVVADEQPFFGEPSDNPLTIPELQNVTGGIALDIYNYSGTGSIFISDLTVSEI